MTEGEIRTAAAWPRGYVQVYTGDGKGKTTAAMGLALRAAGAGLDVFIGQFAKKGDYGEIAALEKAFGSVTVRQYGSGRFITGDPSAEEVALARNGFAEVAEVVADGRHPLVILDEINMAVHFKLIAVDDVLGLIDVKPEPVELVLTGRRADPHIIDRADLVTEMRPVKHFYDEGVAARKGIEY